MIKNNFAVLLAERGLKVSDVVRGTGISKTNLHKLYHKESKRIDLDTIDKLCSFLKVSVGDIFIFEESSMQKNEATDESLVSINVDKNET